MRQGSVLDKSFKVVSEILKVTHIQMIGPLISGEHLQAPWASCKLYIFISIPEILKREKNCYMIMAWRTCHGKR